MKYVALRKDVYELDGSQFSVLKRGICDAYKSTTSRIDLAHRLWMVPKLLILLEEAPPHTVQP